MFVNQRLVSCGFRYLRSVEFIQPKRLYSYGTIHDDLVKLITINTGKELYPRLKRTYPKLYKHYKSGGLDVTVDYVDTKQDGKQYNKVILAVHGSIDDFKSYTRLIENYKNTDIRVIAPNLPKFDLTRRTKFFWHTSEEKAHLIRDFLYKLNIDTIDCLVCHSFGFQSANLLWDKSFNLNVKSVIMCAAETWLEVHNEKIQRGKPLFLFNANWWYKFIELTGIHKRKDLVPVKIETIDDFLLLSSFSFDDDAAIKKVERVKSLLELNIPTVVVFGSREKIISKQSQNAINETLQIGSEQIIVFDQNKHSLEDLKLTHRRTSVIVEDGGHYVHANHPQVVNKLIENLLQF